MLELLNTKQLIKLGKDPIKTNKGKVQIMLQTKLKDSSPCVLCE